MNVTEKVTQWLEAKIGKLLTEVINQNVLTEDSNFNVDECARILLENYILQETSVNNLKCEISIETTDEDFVPDALLQTDGESSDDDNFDFCQQSLEDIILDLQSVSEVQRARGVESLESYPAEELILQNLWSRIKTILQETMRNPKFYRVSKRILQLFRRFILLNENPKVVCEGFGSLAESIIFHIQSINLGKFEDYCEDPENMKSRRLTPTLVNSRISKNTQEIEILFHSMWLLLQSQKLIPFKWSRFNENRLRELIFYFIHMLSSTKNNKNKEQISSLEILSVLDPKATWCNYWCHGASGRLVLFSALKTHKILLMETVDFVISSIKHKEPKKNKTETKTVLPHLVGSNTSSPESKHDFYDYKNQIAMDKLRSKRNLCDSAIQLKENYKTPKGVQNHSAPQYRENIGLANSNKNVKTERTARLSRWIIKGISKDIVKEAKLCHCISMLVCIIQYQGGRSLFPLQLTSRKRRMYISDFTSALVNYIENLLCSFQNNPLTTEEYKRHMQKLLDILRSL